MAQIIVPSRRIWTRQPPGPVDVDLPPGASLRFCMLGSAGPVDLAGNPLTITGLPFKGAWDFSSIRFNLTNRFTSSAKVKNKNRFTVLFVGSLDAPLTTGSCHLFGQFQQNSAGGTAAVYDWSIYESGPADGIYLQVSDGVNGSATTPPNNPVWSSFFTTQKSKKIAASFAEGVPRIAVDGGPVGTGSTLPSNQISDNWGIGSGGYWGGQSAYNPFIRVALGLVIDGYAAQGHELRQLSENPWQLFRPRRQISYFDMAAGGTSTNLVIADATHNHTADAVVLSSDTLLAIYDAVHAHVADNLALSNVTALTIADATHAHSADNLTLGTSGSASLAIADTTHDHLADSLGLSSDTLLAIADAIHAHYADNLSFAPPLSDSEKIQLILDILENRQTLDPVTGLFTLYADDGVTPLRTAYAWEDAEGTVPYRGRALQRLDPLQ